MLLELKVRNLGIIGEINWSLSTGLNVITGETGAGKSLVIDAVETLLAGKIDEETIRYGTGETQIEGVFILSEGKSYDPLRVLMVDKGVQPDDDTLIVKCELRRQGRNIIRINGNTTHHPTPQPKTSQTTHQKHNKPQTQPTTQSNQTQTTTYSTTNPPNSY